MTQLARYEQALASPNVQAFLRMLRWCEGTAGTNGYRTMFGGGLFDGFDDHPRRAITAKLGGKPITSTAAGAYQFLSRTWDGLVKQHGLPDFSPRSQDLGAVALIAGRRALDDVLAGRIEQAIGKCAREWASLPGSPYGQPVKTMPQVLDVYQQHGGLLRPAEAPAAPNPLPTPAEAPAAPPSPVPAPKEAPMAIGPWIAAALPSLIEAVPKLGRIFGSGSDVAERNIKAAELVVSAAKDAIGARNEQELVETLRAGDPGALAAVQQAVHAVWHEVTTDLTGVADARKANAETPQPWLNPALWVTFAVLPLVYVVTWLALTGDFTSEVKSMVVATIVSGGLSGIMGYWLGTSFSSARKTELQGPTKP